MRSELLKSALKRFDHYMNNVHVAKFMFVQETLREVPFTTKKGKTAYKKEPLVIAQPAWVKDHIGFVSNKQLDAWAQEYADSSSSFHERDLQEDGSYLISRIEITRVDKAPRLPSILSDEELRNTWCNNDWSPETTYLGKVSQNISPSLEQEQEEA